MINPSTGHGKMICPVCLASSIGLITWSGLLSSSYDQPNFVNRYRCEQGHTFATVTIFDGKRYQEYYAPDAKRFSEIIICWD